jgi:hypothetical protein
MKTFAIAGVLALSVLAAGCSGCQPITALTGDKPLAGQTVIDEKALYAAEAAMLGADTAAAVAVRQGLLKPGSPQSVQIADYLALAKTGLNAARAAYRVGDATSFNSRLASVQELVGKAWAIIPAASKVTK